MKVSRKDGVIMDVSFENEEGKAAFWHTTAHVLAQAIKRLYPSAKCAIGSSIKEGFYYDFKFDFQLNVSDLTPAICGGVLTLTLKGEPDIL